MHSGVAIRSNINLRTVLNFLQRLIWLLECIFSSSRIFPIVRIFQGWPEVIFSILQHVTYHTYYPPVHPHPCAWIRNPGLVVNSTNPTHKVYADARSRGNLNTGAFVRGVTRSALLEGRVPPKLAPKPAPKPSTPAPPPSLPGKAPVFPELLVPYIEDAIDLCDVYIDCNEEARNL